MEARDVQAVRYVCENGLMAGVSADRFDPNGTLTRGEAVATLWALEGRPVVNYLMDFSDVDPAASYGEAVRWAASQGIAGGYGGGLFGPDDPITREQLAVMLYRYARHEGYDTAQGGMAVREFADYDQIAGYALEAMTWVVEAGVLTRPRRTRWPPARRPLGYRLPRLCWPCPKSPNNQAHGGAKAMKSLDKERRKLEKAGFTGQTLERAMELLERTNASILAETLVKMVTKQEKTPSMALHEAEIKMRELETKLGLSPKEPS